MMKKTLISVILLLAIVFSTHAQQHCFSPTILLKMDCPKYGDEHLARSQRQPLVCHLGWNQPFQRLYLQTYKARQGNYISLTNNRVDRIYEDRYGFCGY